MVRNGKPESSTETVRAKLHIPMHSLHHAPFGALEVPCQGLAQSNGADVLQNSPAPSLAPLPVANPRTWSFFPAMRLPVAFAYPLVRAALYSAFPAARSAWPLISRPCQPIVLPTVSRTAPLVEWKRPEILLYGKDER